MIINLVGLATVKESLGLSDSTYDSAITAMIPKVSTDVRRILNHQYDKYLRGVFNASEATFTIYTYDGWFQEFIKDSRTPYIPIGTVMQHENIPDDTYITAYDPETGIYSLSATPNGTGTYLYPTVNIAQWITISRMIWWKIQQLTTDFGDDNIQAKSIRDTSWTYKTVNKQHNYPQVLINELGTPYAVVG